MNETKINSKSNSKSNSKTKTKSLVILKINSNVYNKLKSIISTLKSYLTYILKTPFIIYNTPLKLILKHIISFLNTELLDGKYQSISKEDSKGNKIKIPAEKSKEGIISLIQLCNALLNAIYKKENEKIQYKVLLYFIIRHYTLLYIAGKNLVILKTYLTTFYKNDKFILHIINNTHLLKIQSYIDLLVYLKLVNYDL
jgi:hypothetical protein